MTFGGNIPYTAIGQNWPRFGYLVNNRWQFSDDLTWVKGRHTVKTGFEYRHHNFPFRGWGQAETGQFNFNRLGTAAFDSRGNNLNATGDPFASFLLGQVQDANQTIPVYPTFNEAYTAAWINDEFKVNDRLTLTLGLRYDYQFARTETEDRVLDLRSEHTQPGGRRPSGRVDLCGMGTGGSGTRKFEHPKRDAWGPRVGFAYRLGEKQAIRGGYGIYYAGVALDQFIGLPTLGFSANSLAPNTSNGVSPGVLPGQWIPGRPASCGRRSSTPPSPTAPMCWPCPRTD